jgi:1-acyl-sn-glycerol-3-phosphate acyltransferase
MTLFAVLLSTFRWLILVLWTVVWVSIAAIATLLTFNRDVALVLARNVWAPGMLFWAGLRLRADPLPDVDWGKPHIFVMNHQSMMDIPCAFATLPANLRFVAKHTLALVPFLGWYMWMTGMIFINRSKRQKALESLERAGKRIRQGKSIIAFPEGTRSKDGRILPFKKGPFVLACEAGVPIIPIAADGAGKVMGPGSFTLRGGPVRLRVGQPIETQGVSRDELLQRVHSEMIRLHTSIGGAGGDERAFAAPGQEGVFAQTEERA